MAKTSRPPSTLTLPMRCSTVTPGKFATFWRRPVSRLNRVDLPELGGPTMATMCRRVSIAGGGGRVATEQPWQSLIKPEPLHLSCGAQNQLSRRITPKGNLGTVHAEHSRIAARRRMTRRDRMPGEEPKFHQSPCVVFGEIQSVQNPRFPVLQL